MGTFGTSLYDDDHALDVRACYQDLRRARILGPAATSLLLEQCFEGNHATQAGDPIFWLVLADLQWKDGALDPLVASQARRVIGEGEGLSGWEDPADRQKRVRAYERLGRQLQGSMPAAKVTANPYSESCPWEIGQIVAFRLGRAAPRLAGRYVLLQVVNHYTKLGGKSPLFELLNWCGAALPDNLPAHPGYLNTFQFADIDPHTDEWFRQKVRESLETARQEGKISPSVTLEDLVRDKMSTRVPVVSLTGSETARQRISPLGQPDTVIDREKILTTMVWQTWKTFDTFCARTYEQYYRG